MILNNIIRTSPSDDYSSWPGAQFRVPTVGVEENIVKTCSKQLIDFYVNRRYRRDAAVRECAWESVVWSIIDMATDV